MTEMALFFFLFPFVFNHCVLLRTSATNCGLQMSGCLFGFFAIHFDGDALESWHNGPKWTSAKTVSMSEVAVAWRLQRVDLIFQLHGGLC